MKKFVLISFVLVALGAGVMAYARYATLSSDTVPVKIEQRLREKRRREGLIVIRTGIIQIIAFW